MNIRKKTRKVQAIILVMIAFMIASAMSYPVAANSDDHLNNFDGSVSPILLTAPMTGRIDYSRDIDCFYLSVPANQKIRVKVTADKNGAPQAIKAKLYALTDYDTSYRLLQENVLTPVANYFEFSRVSGTTNYISIEDLGTSDGVTYQIELSIVQNDDYPNNFDVPRPTVTNEVPMTGRIDYPGDVDCFNLDLPYNQNVRVTVTATKNGVAESLLVKHFELTRYDTYQRLNGTYFLTPTANNFSFPTLDFTRSYYISVEHPGYIDGISYKIEVNVIPSGST